MHHHSLIALACLLGVAAASYSGYGYHGKWYGKCAKDGLYYRDETSFVFCSNGYSSVQECSPGTKNSPYTAYSKGYSYRDFCDVNLVDSGYAVAAPAYHEPEPSYEEPSYEPEPSYEEPKYEEPSYEEPSYGYSYHGKYPGKCGADGLYYKDYDSFVFCSNGNSYVQPCAPGTRNSAYGKYSYGGKYDYRDFCDINLVDGGYASHDGYGYEYVKPSYKEPSHYAPEPYYAPEPKYEEPKYEEPKYEEPSYEPSYGYSYHGKYPGKCEYDGLYYKDYESFIFCVNGLSYVQPCAPGTRNSGYSKFSYGAKYSERDFCDVNLVDSGYTVKGKY